ncbi:Thylakoid lumenal protein 2, chloroplastic [Zea mays]|uniref:Thylakoid lumenal protein 2, chloroplastic n=1 Tax=Zea mays TaxID=4577 RepID=A0A3L6G2G2_MAIZE|nr:Thylakoid lumenal protein 2, chloroplastic [Zea mays]
MAIALLPSVRLLPQSLSRRPPPTSSPLSVRRPRQRALPLPRVHCRAGRTSDPLAAAREAAAFWAGKLAGAVPWKAAVSGVVALAVSFTCLVGLANARTGVNKPELLPKEFTTVIDVAGFLSSGQVGLAIKDFWQVDERTIVFVADPTFGNIINFNIGPLVDLDVPRSFWSQVSGKYGNMFYWKEKVTFYCLTF